MPELLQKRFFVDEDDHKQCHFENLDPKGDVDYPTFFKKQAVSIYLQWREGVPWR